MAALTPSPPLQFTADTYLRVPLEVCRRLIRLRQLTVPAHLSLEELIHEELAVMLKEADEHDPSWLASLVRRQVITVVTLADDQLYVYGAYYGLVFERQWSQNTGKLIACAVIQMLLTPFANQVQQLLEADNRTILVPAAEYYLRHSCHYLPSNILGEVFTNQGRLSGPLLQSYTAYYNRHHLLTNCGTVQFWQDIYQVPKKYHSDPIAYIIRSKPALWWESYLIQAQQGTLNRSDAYTTLGMIVPPTVTDDSYVHYLQNNISHYLSVLKHQNAQLLPLSEWTHLSYGDQVAMLGSRPDLELFTAAQAYIPYGNRAQLLERLAGLVDQPNFFLPLSLTRATNTNSETVMATPLKELPLDYSIAIAFGTLSSYWVYELDDLIQSFSVELNGTTGPRRPESAMNSSVSTQQQYFEFPQLQQLSEVLTVMKDSADIVQLKGMVNKHYHRLLAALNPNDEFLSHIKDLDASIMAEIIELLQYIIGTGMYMRRWRGPGYAYPLADFAPGSPEQSLINSQRLIHLNEWFKKPAIEKVFTHIPICLYDRTNQQLIPNQHSRFMSLFEDVRSDKHCIILASSDFVFTAAYYLRLLGRNDLVTFNPADIIPRG